MLGFLVMEYVHDVVVYPIAIVDTVGAQKVARLCLYSRHSYCFDQVAHQCAVFSLMAQDGVMKVKH